MLRTGDRSFAVLTRAAAVYAGYSHTFARMMDGTVFGWGSTARGDGATDSTPVPAQIAGVADARDVNADALYALDGVGRVWTWRSRPAVVRRL